ncbi:type IV toxin-antitoxin system AbiEi family antitoxin domain-containing protein [Frankia canadensis]|nr:type IV toxin-antitoxin system AbiEi family antitoxin domain-containing protein [Frankia canadensis]
MSTPHDRVVALARRQDDVVTSEQARQLGMSDDALSRRRRHGWSSPLQGALLIPPVRDEVRARARAAQSVLGGTICGRTAARLHHLPGLAAFRSDEPTDLALPTGNRRRDRTGYRRRRLELRDSDIVDLGGLRVCTVPRTLEDLALLCDREEFVSVVDAMLFAGQLAAADVLDLRGRVSARPNGRRARGWWDRIDGRAESPLETRVRLLLGDFGLLPDECQWPVCDPTTGRFVARVDFAWPSLRLAVEADGVGPHSVPAALYRDRFRQNALVRLRWEILRFTWWDVTVGAAQLVKMVGAAVRAAESRRGDDASPY